MPIGNNWVFTETNFNSEKFLENTGNVYRYVSQRPYVNKKDPNESGVALTLAIIKDTTDYGNDKKTGMKRDNNTLNSFDVTILNKKSHLNFVKGDQLKLIGFIQERSFVIGFDLILRFQDVEKINVDAK